MVDKFSQVASNIPAANADTNKQYLVINGYPVVFSFSNEPNPEAFERIRDILLATSYTKKAGRGIAMPTNSVDENLSTRYTEDGCGALVRQRTTTTRSLATE